MPKSQKPRKKQVRPAEVKSRSVFVIMPFHATPTRNRDDLTAFFHHNIKDVIEQSGELQFRHVVKRSDDTFNITEQIIRDLYAADIVICDLSGFASNPNVMYELGVRLSISSKPVILIREKHPKNTLIFDIGGFYAFEYNPHQYASLEHHLTEKLSRLETGEDRYESPVLKVLQTSPQVIRLISIQQIVSQLVAIDTGMYAMLFTVARAIFVFAAEMGVDLKSGLAMTEPDAFEAVRLRRAVLVGLDWSKFNCRPVAPPGLTGYLQEPRLQHVASLPIAKTFNASLFEYYRWFFASDIVWTRPTYQTSYEFYYSTLLLRGATQAIIALLAPDGSKETHKLLDVYAGFVQT